MQLEERPDLHVSAEKLRDALVESIAGRAIREGQLEKALETRDLIGQAKGILMERERVTGDQAFEMLRSSSQHMNLKLRDVAAMLVASVEQNAVDR